MELVKNNAAGIFFMLLDDTGGPSFFFIRPEGRIRQLKQYLFTLQNITNPGEALTKHQLKKCGLLCTLSSQVNANNTEKG